MAKNEKKIQLHFDALSKVANTAKAPVIPQVGDKMPDGTIFVGISPDTKRPMYAAPADAPKGMDANQAENYAKTLDVGGKRDFRLPTKAELDVLFQNREKGALKGTFNQAGSGPAGWYRSLTPYSNYYKCGQRFKDGCQYLVRDEEASVRCVR